MSCIEDFNPAPFRKIEVKRNRNTSGLAPSGGAPAWTYAELDAYQREILAQVCEGAPGTLLLSELAPVITYGRRTPERDLVGALGPSLGIGLGASAVCGAGSGSGLVGGARSSAGPSFGSAPGEGFGWSGLEVARASLGITRYAADRGGLATYHGPGQWVLFPVESLQTLTGDRRGVRKAVQLLLDVALEVGLEYDPSAQIREGAELGVWTSQGKFAAVGIHVHSGVLLHGLSVNGFRTPTSFQGLRPCGLDAPVAFLLPEPNEEAFLALGQRLVSALLEKLNPTSRSH